MPAIFGQFGRGTGGSGKRSRIAYVMVAWANQHHGIGGEAKRRQRAVAVTTDDGTGDKDESARDKDERADPSQLLMDAVAEVRLGTTEEAIEFAANEVWERTGGVLVEKVMEKLGAAGGEAAGKYLGGEIGLVIGVLCPEIAVPVVLGACNRTVLVVVLFTV